MAGTTARRRGTKAPVQKKVAPVRRTKKARSDEPSGAVIVLSGATPIRRQKAAEVLAEELQLDLSSVDLSAVVSKYIGETERNLNRVFDMANRHGSILFFDEADALFGKRMQVHNAHDRYANAEGPYLLQCIEDHQGLVILTTNGKSRIEEAFSPQKPVIVLGGTAKKKPKPKKKAVKKK